MTTWLFKPFNRLAGGAALTAGLAAILLVAVIGWLAGIHADGVLDLHFGPDLPLWRFMVQGLVNWICLALMLWAVGHWLTATRYRVLDLFGTQALARWPLLLAVLPMSIPAYRRTGNELAAKLLESAPEETAQLAADPAFLGDALLVTAGAVPVLLAIIWMVWLMYHGFALVFNVKGSRAVLGFIGALLAAELVSKLIHLFVLA